eukprot:TRINITY_DN8582_c0_g1_i2.p1 TRINITY_DN8582_c0_g1~~TRINITY_DN8582_c0_g1_i2.p1  ORF type:complete len:273 (-),score=43.54 TRINITY_DN8582_c0_g1_i2:62-880(-)
MFLIVLILKNSRGPLPPKPLPYSFKNVLDHNTLSDPHVCFIIRTRKSQEASILGLVSAILASKSMGVSFRFLDTTNDFHSLIKMVDMINNIYGWKVAKRSPILHSYIRSTYPYVEKFNDLGFIQTDIHIQHQILDNPESDCKFLVVTNGSDLYGTGFMDAIKPELPQQHMIGVDYVSHSTYPEKFPWIARAGTDMEVFAEFEWDKIDLGATVLNVEQWRKNKLTFLLDAMKADPQKAAETVHTAGQKLIMSFKETTEKRKIIRRALYLQQEL